MLPNYKDGSIINLMSSIAGALGGRTGYGGLKILSSKKLKSKNIVLIVVDGLGFEYLEKKKSVFNENLVGSMTSVFLSTTASAITSFLTGVAPQQHGFTGWYVFLKEIGAISTVLPFNLRFGGPQLSEYGLEIKKILEEKSFMSKIKVSGFSVMPKKIINSDFTNITSKGSKKFGYENLDGFFRQIRRAINYNKKRKYVYAYWSEFDAVSHEYGVGSKKCEKHFKELDRKMRRFFKSIKNTNTTVIVTADHGFVNVDLKDWIWVKEHPKLMECLTMPLCGEGRAAFCYVRPSKVKQFEKYVRTKFRGKCELYKSQDLINRGWFGAGRVNPKLFDRVGDYIIICKKGYYIEDTVEIKDKKKLFKGHHGGISKEEMLVPLIVVKTK